MKRYLIALALLALGAPALAAADAPPAPTFNVEQRLSDVQARYATNRERVTALNAEAAAMQKEAEALLEIKRLTAPKEEAKAEEPQP